MTFETIALFFAVAFVVYLIAVRLPRRRWVPTRAIAVISGIGLLSASMAGPADWIPESMRRAVGVVVLGLSIVGAGWAIGRAVRERREYTTRAAEQLAARAVTEERLRIARELHDVVAHSMSLITVKAGVASHVAKSRPDEVTGALQVIEHTSRNALTEMRHMLDVLRSETPPAELAPTPGPTQLAELADRASLAGVTVDLCIYGIDNVPEGVGLSVYRIVQEALTNVVKHAAPARCTVRIEGDSNLGEVRIDVTDDGPGVRVLPDRPNGHGLIGMRERVGMYGGEFRAGPGPDGGFAVSARLPYENVPS